MGFVFSNTSFRNSLDLLRLRVNALTPCQQNKFNFATCDSFLWLQFFFQIQHGKIDVLSIFELSRKLVQVSQILYTFLL